jgi:hypothetical protein
MCRILGVQPSVFYAWIKAPFSLRALEDARQTALVKRARNDSGKVYGYRKIHDDLIEMGETVCENRVAGLARVAGRKLGAPHSSGSAWKRSRKL